MTSISFLKTRNNSYELYPTNDSKESKQTRKHTSTETIISNVNNDADVKMTFDVIIDHHEYERIIFNMSYKITGTSTHKKLICRLINCVSYKHKNHTSEEYDSQTDCTYSSYTIQKTKREYTDTEFSIYNIEYKNHEIMLYGNDNSQMAKGKISNGQKGTNSFSTRLSCNNIVVQINCTICFELQNQKIIITKLVFDIDEVIDEKIDSQ